MLSLVNRYEFQKCVDRYGVDHGTGRLNCWNKFAQLFFGQLTGRNGLRDICKCLSGHGNRLYHLGIKQGVNQSSLSRANENRDWRIYGDFGTCLIDLVAPLYSTNPPAVEGVDRDIFAVDSTTISVSLNLVDWAQGKYSRGAAKMHTVVLGLRGNIPAFIHITDGKYHDVNALGEITPIVDAINVMDKAYIDFKRLYEDRAEAFFVVSAKSNLNFRAATSRKVDKATGLRCDQSIKLQVPKSRKQYPKRIRRIKYHDRDKDLTLVFLTNEFDLDPLEIAAVYKGRWQIEVFFKWVKQNLEIKKLWGHSQNAVKIHLWIAISTYLIVAFLKKQLDSEYSIYEMTQVLSISTFDKTPVNELYK